ncbi:uncharacterized protein LOC107882937 isoform X2 [Acyrthosiphon pisum]|uniref:Uncharacterized protein n=1 Tax=Acyrthosiphon pisum TaxID=7029 RepID=A0A8R2JQ50_ACYPI|nr:uncharacterized protein LOC107882937 isoform X2 [Acyrthosiphon pisum]
MFLSIKLKHLLITLVLTSIFAEIAGIKWGAAKAAKKKKKITDKKNKETEGLCETLEDFYRQKIFIKVANRYFKSEEGKGLKTRVNAGKKAKRGIFSRSVTGQMKRLVKKYEESGDKEKHAKEIQKWVDRFYDLSCSKIMPHYNAFYIFYNDYSKSKEHKGFVKTATCDYFVRIPRIDTENEIPKKLTNKV